MERLLIPIEYSPHPLHRVDVSERLTREDDFRFQCGHKIREAAQRRVVRAVQHLADVAAGHVHASRELGARHAGGLHRFDNQGLGLEQEFLLLEQSPVITTNSLPDHFNESVEGHDLDAVRYRAVMDALAEHDGNQTHAARTLGVARGTLNRWLSEYRKSGLKV